MPWQDIVTIREKSPLVHNITNYVVMNTTANALLAVGASPVMAHAVEEVEELAAVAGALVINIGTLSPPWVEAMLLAGRAAKKNGVPLVFDPVGCGATRLRSRAAQELIQNARPSIIRGNASEIHALLHAGSGGKGVDSLLRPDQIENEATELSRATGAVVSVSGPVDLIVQGDKAVRVANGHPLMARVTGMGCTASAVTGAFAAVNDSPLKAAAHAMALMGVAGEMAAERCQGPGSFWPLFLDTLSLIQESDLARRLKVQW
ncbi:MAG: hydroxyethylthiazole kinase [Desulfobacteraceae bacterium]|nr:hydroxyethylthiazole kinase [Desulfobacteraceae bacterium]